MKVQVKNYQIVSNANLEFLPGLNVIQGPSNNGKSSLFKAIKSAFYTVPGTTPIKFGEDSYIVGINHNEHTVVFKKGLKDSIYLVDGEKYTKFGTTTPAIVSDVLNIRELELNGNKEQLNFWDQMDYPFLLNRSGGDLFKFIVDSGDNDQVSKALKSMVSDRQQLSKDIDVLQGSINLIDLDITNLSEQLESLKEQAEVSNTVISLKPKVLRLTYMNQIKDRLDNIKVNQKELSTKREYADEMLNNYNLIDSNLSSLRSKIDIVRNLFVSLSGIIGDLSDVNENLIYKKKYSDLLSFNSSRLYDLKNKKSSIDSILKDKERNEVLLKSIPHLDFDFNNESKLKELRETKKELDNLFSKVNNIEMEKAKVKDKLGTYDELVNLFDVCPLCGNKIHI